MENEKNTKLRKDVGVFTAMSIVVGCVIGAGVFFKPYAIYQATGGAPGLGILAWIIGGIVSILGALTFAEVAVMIPKTGGMIAILNETYNDKIGFLAGWMQVVIFFPTYIAGYGVKVGSELSEYLGAGVELPIAIGIIILLVVINVLGTKVSGKMQVVSTICKLIPLVLIMVCAFFIGKGGNPVLVPMVGEGKSIGGALGTTLLAVLFAFEGWTNVGSVAGEMKNPGKDLPKAIVGGVSIIMAVYLIINLAYLWVIPADQLMSLESPGAAVAIALFGPIGGTIIKIGIIISVIGAGNGFLLAGSRVAYCLAEDGKLPCSDGLSKLNKKSSPANVIILVGTLSCIYALLGKKFDFLTDLGTLSCWIFYTLTFTCVIRLRRKMPDAERKYKVPLYPVIPILAIISGLFVIYSQLFLSGSYGLIISLCSIGITLLGLPVYFLVRAAHRKKDGGAVQE